MDKLIRRAAGRAPGPGPEGEPDPDLDARLQVLLDHGLTLAEARQLLREHGDQESREAAEPPGDFDGGARRQSIVPGSDLDFDDLLRAERDLRREQRAELADHHHRNR
jgi:hypothetical protein